MILIKHHRINFTLWKLFNERNISRTCSFMDEVSVKSKLFSYTRIGATNGNKGQAHLVYALLKVTKGESACRFRDCYS